MTESKKEMITKLIGVILMFAGAFIGSRISENITLTDSSGYQPHWWIYGKNILNFGRGIFWGWNILDHLHKIFGELVRTQITRLTN